MNRPRTPPGSFANHFGPRAPQYAEARPRYPRALVHYLAATAGGTRVAWDCATGNGQAAVGLAERFAQVVATDASAEMIERAVPHPRVTYRVARYESGLPDAGADLVTVAQALHWLDADALMREVRRVLAPGGVFAAWCYATCRIAPGVDEVVDRFYRVTLGSYWLPERRQVEEGYRDIALPLRELAVPPMEMAEEWTLPQFTAYVRTWSAVARCIAARGDEPVVAFESALREVWGIPMLLRRVRFPLAFRAGHVA